MPCSPVSGHPHRRVRSPPSSADGDRNRPWHKGASSNTCCRARRLVSLARTDPSGDPTSGQGSVNGQACHPGLTGGGPVRFTAKLVGAALVACAALTVHPQAAMAAAADDTVNAIQRSAPEVLQDRVATLTTGAPTAVGQSVSVTLPSSTAEGVKIRRANVPDITVGLPSAAAAAPARKVAAGVVAFDNRDGSTTVPIVKSNGSVEIVTTISSSGGTESVCLPGRPTQGRAPRAHRIRRRCRRQQCPDPGHRHR